eukprot:gene5696-biopygen14804
MESGPLSPGPSEPRSLQQRPHFPRDVQWARLYGDNDAVAQPVCYGCCDHTYCIYFPTVGEMWKITTFWNVIMRGKEEFCARQQGVCRQCCQRCARGAFACGHCPPLGETATPASGPRPFLWILPCGPRPVRVRCRSSLLGSQDTGAGVAQAIGNFWLGWRGRGAAWRGRGAGMAREWHGLSCDPGARAARGAGAHRRARRRGRAPPVPPRARRRGGDLCGRCGSQGKKLAAEIGGILLRRRSRKNSQADIGKICQNTPKENWEGRGPVAGRTIELKETDADRTLAVPFLPLLAGAAGPPPSAAEILRKKRPLRKRKWGIRECTIHNSAPVGGRKMDACAQNGRLCAKWAPVGGAKVAVKPTGSAGRARGFGVAGGAAGVERRFPNGRGHDQTHTLGERLGCWIVRPRAGVSSRRTGFFLCFGASPTRSLAFAPRSEPPRGRAPGAQTKWMLSGSSLAFQILQSVWCGNAGMPGKRPAFWYMLACPTPAQMPGQGEYSDKCMSSRHARHPGQEQPERCGCCGGWSGTGCGRVRSPTEDLRTYRGNGVLRRCTRSYSRAAPPERTMWKQSDGGPAAAAAAAMPPPPLPAPFARVVEQGNTADDAWHTYAKHVLGVM